MQGRNKRSNLLHSFKNIILYQDYMGTLSRVQFSQSEQENFIKCKTGSGD